MKKTFLSAASVVAALALPGLPAMAQPNEITVGSSITTTGPAAPLGIPERVAAYDLQPRVVGPAFGVPHADVQRGQLLLCPGLRRR